ncbi:MAG: hypothetical protein LUH08_02115 [Ruminococcus sp.]|nr:hypothetical protein [Ruminococcus sp.]MCD7772837.1 hypothetical protein [Ruminococcus sp.]
MFKNMSNKAWFLITGIACAIITVLIIIGVILERVSVMFAFPFGIFAIILIASAFSVDEGKQKPKKPQKKTKKQIAEEQYVSPFFADDTDDLDKPVKGRKRK